MMRNIGIIGCSGFIGSHLLERLLESGRYTVVGVDTVSVKIEHILPHPLLTFVKGDIYTLNNRDRIFEACDTIVSLAALCNPALYNSVTLDVVESNFQRPLELVKWCTNTGRRIIHFSSSEVYGRTVQGIAGENLVDRDRESQYLLSEEVTPLILGPIQAQRWSYACAKQLLERVIYAYGIEKGLEYTIVRPFNFIGPRMDYIPGIDGEGIPRVIACFMESLLFEKPLKLVDGGHNRRTFTDIDDAVDAVMRIIEKPEQSCQQIFNIGNPDNEVTIRELAHIMVGTYNDLYPHHSAKYEIREVSAEEFYGAGYEDCDRRVPDITKAQTLLGWIPVTGLKEALVKTMVSYVESYGKKHAA